MELTFEVTTQLIVEPQPLTGKVKLIGVQQALSASEGVDLSQYITPEGLPNVNGCKTITNALVHGLAANIHNAHQNGYRDSAEHLRWIIEHLTKFFAEVANVSEGNLNKVITLDGTEKRGD